MRVACHRKTGELYVLSVMPHGCTKVLRKFSPLKDRARELASFPLPETSDDACMALDDTSVPPVVWVATRAAYNITFNAAARVFRLEDKGASFVETKHPIAFEIDSPCQIDAGRQIER